VQLQSTDESLYLEVFLEIRRGCTVQSDRRRGTQLEIESMLSDECRIEPFCLQVEANRVFIPSSSSVPVNSNDPGWLRNSLTRNGNRYHRHVAYSEAPDISRNAPEIKMFRRTLLMLFVSGVSFSFQPTPIRISQRKKTIVSYPSSQSIDTTRRPPRQSRTSLNFMGSDGGILGVGTPELVSSAILFSRNSHLQVVYHSVGWIFCIGTQ